jgi:transposase
MKSLAFAGNDVHKNSVTVAVYRSNETEPFLEKTVATDKGKIQKLYASLAAEYEIRACYEASCLGYVFQEWLAEIGVHCDVIAPGSIPLTKGRRIKTDSRDARALAIQYRAGSLSIVHVPTKQERSVRGLTRMRSQIVCQLHQARQHLLKFLLGFGFVYRDGSHWTQKHRSWLTTIDLDDDADQFELDQYRQMIEFIEGQLRCTDRKIDEVAASPEYAERVGILRCFRGINTITAISIIAEAIDFSRFKDARHFMAFLGMVPSQYSSGESRVIGSITKRGNSRLRRLLVEAAWHYRHRPYVSDNLQMRQKDQSVAAVAQAYRAQQRLHTKYTRMTARGKCSQKTVVAVARELSGFVWAAMTSVPVVH